MSELKPRIKENGIDYILSDTQRRHPGLEVAGETPPHRKVRTDAREYLREVCPARLHTLSPDGGIVEISCRPERTGTETVRHHHGADESCRGRDRGIEAYPSNGMGAALQ